MMVLLEDFLAAFLRLPAVQRKVWHYRCWGYADQEISRELHISERMVNVSAFRAAAAALPDHDGSARSRLICYLLGKADVNEVDDDALRGVVGPGG